jgi:hypothetical protein
MHHDTVGLDTGAWQSTLTLFRFSGASCCKVHRDMRIAHRVLNEWVVGWLRVCRERSSPTQSVEKLGRQSVIVRQPQSSSDSVQRFEDGYNPNSDMFIEIIEGFFDATFIETA